MMLYDRGYLAFWLIRAHQDKHIDFCMRVPWNHFSEVRDFYRSNKKQKIVMLKPSKEAKSLCYKYRVSDKPIKVRLIRFELPETTEILIISVTDR